MEMGFWSGRSGAFVALVMDWTNSGDCANTQRMGPVAHFLTNSEDVLDRTGHHRADQEPATTYGFSGMDGTPFLMPRLKPRSLWMMSMRHNRIDPSVHRVHNATRGSDLSLQSRVSSGSQVLDAVWNTFSGGG